MDRFEWRVSQTPYLRLRVLFNKCRHVAFRNQNEHNLHAPSMSSLAGAAGDHSARS